MEEKRYVKRKEKAVSDGNREQLALSCNHLGHYYNQLGKYQCAEREYQQEAEIYAKLGKPLEMAKARRMVGEMFMLLCEFDNAKEQINIYLKTVKKLQNKVEEQRAYATLGRAHLLHGQSTSDSSATNTLEQLKLAERSFLKSLLLIRELTGQISKLEQLDMQARCYLNIGVVKEHLEEFEESIAYIEKAIKISKSHDIFELTHLCYISMSLLYHCKKNDSTLALRYCNLALEVAKRLPNKVQKICETLITKSEILIKEGDFASAKQILTKAYKKNTPDENDRSAIERTLRIVVKICQTLDALVTTSSVDYGARKCLYEKLGDGNCHLQNYSKALGYYLQMLECAQTNSEPAKNLIPIYVSLYQTYKDNKQYDKALEYLWKEFELNKDAVEPTEAVTTLCEIAEVCELQSQSFWTIQNIYQKAKEKAAQAGGGDAQKKLERIVFVRLKKLQLKHQMNLLAEELMVEAKSRGIDPAVLDDESDTESDTPGAANEQNTPELGDDVCLDDLTDSDTSDLDETEKPRPHRLTRGTRSLTIKRNNKGETQLHQACIAGNTELVRRLLDQGHVVNVRDHAGWIPLHEASNHGFREIVALLLDRGGAAAINDKGGTSCDGITPLYDACSNGFLDVVELLLERGADPTVRTDFGETCINGLDKWRRSATLTEGEQAHYAQVRATLLRPLSKVGICKAGGAASAPLTNANVERDASSAEDDDNDNVQDSLSNEEDEDNIRPRAAVATRRTHTEHNRSSEGSKILKDSNKPFKSRTAAASVEYKNVMEQLKRPNHRAHADDDNVFPSSSSSTAKQKRSALLDTQEVDYASWLIDDVGPEKKKRRYAHTPTIDAPPPQPTRAFNTTTTKSTSKENLHDSAISSWGAAAELAVDTLTPPETTDAFQVLLEAGGGTTSTQQKQRHRHKLSLSRSSSFGSSNASSSSAASIVPAACGSKHSSRTTKSKYQASLLDSGFCRFRSESPVSSEDSGGGFGGGATTETVLSLRATEPDSTTTSIHLLISPAKSKSSPMKVQATTSLSAGPLFSSTFSFKVKVEDELLLVPIERKKLNEITIHGLAEEAARRYYNLVGLKPVLRLKTADGFAYEENDAVNVAIEQNMILATVLEWKIAPLSQRYEEMCHQFNKDINPDIQSVLERAHVSNSLHFEDMWLTPQLTEPLFKAMLHQANLRVLDLANNFIQNEGCAQLAKSLPTLKQLKVLNLKGNLITSDGLEAVLSCGGDDTLVHLEELNLSQNPLGNQSVHILDRFCNSSAGKSLRKLVLSQCELTNLYDFDLCCAQLSAFDISFNQLTDASMRKLLVKLNASRLQHLNVSYTRTTTTVQYTENSVGSSVVERVIEFFESGTCEQFKYIRLCGCGLSDAHVYRLMQRLSQANELELLDITDNVKLSASALQFVLDQLPQLRKLIAVNCRNLVDVERIQRLAQLKHMPDLLSLTLGEGSSAQSEQMLRSLWRSHWSEKAKVSAYDGNLLFYVHDKDLLL